MKTVTASDFKAHCLQYMDLVNKKHKTITITKHGEPVANLVPYAEEAPALFGAMEGTGMICGDVMEPIDVEWGAHKQ